MIEYKEEFQNPVKCHFEVLNNFNDTTFVFQTLEVISYRYRWLRNVTFVEYYRKTKSSSFAPDDDASSCPDVSIVLSDKLGL